MKGKSRTKAEKHFQYLICSIGCIVCRNEGIENDYVSPHHIDGRTKEGAHKYVLPLCERHHQIPDNNKPRRWFTRHANKSEFVEAYGTEDELYQQCLKILGE